MINSIYHSIDVIMVDLAEEPEMEKDYKSKIRKIKPFENREN